MKFELDKTIQIIEKTPKVLNSLLDGIAVDWIYNNEGEGTWSAFDVVGHLIICEQTDFITRADIILSDATHKVFAPINMTAQFQNNQGRVIKDLLQEFEQLRKENIQKLIAYHLTEDDLDKKGIHPKLGETTLRQLLATWVTHDLNHIAQITRIIAKQYKKEVGPFIAVTSILN